RTRLAVALAFSVLAAPLLVETQQAKVYKIGLLSPPPGAYVAAFEETLRQLGYVRGRNVVFETRSSGYRAEDVPDQRWQLVRAARLTLWNETWSRREHWT